MAKRKKKKPLFYLQREKPDKIPQAEDLTLDDLKRFREYEAAISLPIRFL